MTPPGSDHRRRLGASALPPGTYDGQGGHRHRRRHRPREGDRHRVRPSRCVGRHPEPRRGATGRPGWPRSRRPAERRSRSRCDIRDAESVAAAFDAVESGLGPIDVLVNNAAGNFPVPAEDMSPNAWRTVVDIVLNGTFLCCRDLARRSIPAERDGAIVNVGASYAWTGGPGIRPLRGGQGRGEEPHRDAGRRVGPLRHPGQRPGARAHAPRGRDGGHRRGAGQVRGPGLAGAGRDGSASRGSWPGPPPTSAPRSPPTSAVHSWWWTGPTGSGATPCSPPFTPIREQLERPPFGDEPRSG